MSSTNYNPDYLLFGQHGWADTGEDLGKLAQAIASPNSILVIPSFQWTKTKLRIRPLIRDVEQIAAEYIFNYPKTPLRIIGHSIGGIIWLEVLSLHPEWWEKVQSLVLLGSPVGGSDLTRIADLFDIGIGVARDSGKDRRSLAEEIAQNIPTLSIASDLNSGTDGVVKVENTKFAHCRWVLLSDIRHADLKRHPSVVPVIQNFWANPQIDRSTADLATQVIRRLQSVPGMTDAHWSHFEQSDLKMSLDDGVTIHSWKSPVGLHYIFVAARHQECVYGGSVSGANLETALKELEEHFSSKQIVSD